MVNRERVIVTGGRGFGYAPPDATPERRAQAKRERDFVCEALMRELRIRTAWAFDRLLVVVGDCPTGVDAITASAMRGWGIAYKRYEADWQHEGLAAGPRRNGRMVADGAIAVLAFPGGLGTASCKRLAVAAGIAVTEPEWLGV